MTMKYHRNLFFDFILGLCCTCYVSHIFGEEPENKVPEYKIVYRYQTGPLGLLKHPVAVKVPVQVQDEQPTEQPAEQPQKKVVEPRTCEVYQSLTDEEKILIDKLDELRAKLGLPRLTLVAEIVEDSRKWSQHMGRVKRLYHGSNQENAAVGHEDGLSTFRLWRGSAGHNAKLLNRNDTVCGIGVDGNWWTYRAAPSLEAYVTGKDPESDIKLAEAKAQAALEKAEAAERAAAEKTAAAAEQAALKKAQAAERVATEQAVAESTENATETALQYKIVYRNTYSTFGGIIGITRKVAVRVPVL